MQDEKIVELYWNRDEAAIEATRQKYGSYLFVVADNILSCAEDSKECVNDTYLAAWNSIPPHKPQALQSYLCKLIRRIAIDIYRSKNRLKRNGSAYDISLSELSECISDKITPENQLEYKRLAKAISDFLRTVPQKNRVLFLCRYYFMDSLRDSAKYCKIRESTAKTILYRTRCSLREYLIKEGFDL